MTAFRADGTRITKSTFPKAAVTVTDPVVEVTADVYLGRSFGLGGIGDNRKAGPRGVEATRTLLYRAGAKVRQSEIDGLFEAATFSTVVPATGPVAGGTTFTITGTNLTGTSGVTFGGTAATAVKVQSDTTITGLTPPRAAGAVTVVVKDDSGDVSKASGFTYA